MMTMKRAVVSRNACPAVSCVAVAYAVGHAITNRLRGHIGSAVVLRRTWDYLWMRHGRESRMVLVETEEDWLYGYLADISTSPTIEAEQEA